MCILIKKNGIRARAVARGLAEEPQAPLRKAASTGDIRRLARAGLPSMPLNNERQRDPNYTANRTHRHKNDKRIKTIIQEIKLF